MEAFAEKWLPKQADNFKITALEYAGEAPVLYVFDEYHGHCVSTDENIAFARRLITSNEIELVGLEHFVTCYCDDPDWKNWNCRPLMECNGDYPRFARGVLGYRYGCYLAGVDSEMLCNEIQLESSPGEQYYLKSGSHPFQLRRSEHFLRSLAYIYSKQKLTGNAILNCGSAHGQHIEDWFANGIAISMLSIPFSFVRLRAPSFPP